MLVLLAGLELLEDFDVIEVVLLLLPEFDVTEELLLRL
jgi:hypothetical protein